MSKRTNRKRQRLIEKSDTLKCKCCKTEIELEQECEQCNKVFCQDCLLIDKKCGALTFLDKGNLAEPILCYGTYTVCKDCYKSNVCESCGTNTMRCCACFEIHSLLQSEYKVQHKCPGWFSKKTGLIEIR